MHLTRWSMMVMMVKICANRLLLDREAALARPLRDQIGWYEITEPSLPISFTCTRCPCSSYQMSCE
jgi:hypothetical protein